MKEISSRRIAPILGALGALGPLSIDMYFPGMPEIARHLNVGEDAVQFSLMAFFAGLMIGQFFYGPLSDRIGRKRMIYTGLPMIATIALCGIAAWRVAFTAFSKASLPALKEQPS